MTTRANDRPVSIPGLPPAPAGFLRPVHGGLLRPPWKPGENGNPQGKRGDEYLETVRLARQASPDAMRKLIAKMDSNDERVATIAIQGVLDRAFGKPKEYDPKAERPTGLMLDVTKLTREELDMLVEITRRGAVKQAASDDDTSVTIVDAETVTESPAAR